jgi:tetratricopeptide (TPR) repeat protein
MKYYLALFLLFLSFVSFGQNEKKIDSLREVLYNSKEQDSIEFYNKLFDIFFYEIPDSANYFLNKSIAFSKNNESKNLRDSYFRKIDFFLYKKNQDSLEFYESNLSKLVDSINNKTSFNILLLARSKITIEQNKLDLSNNNLEILLKKINSNVDWTVLSEIYYLKALIYYKQKDDARSLQYFNKVDSLHLLNKSLSKDLVYMNIYRSNISRMTFTEEGVKRAGEYLDEALKISRRIKLTRLENVVYSRFADQYGMIGDYDNSIKNINLAIPYFISVNDLETVSKLLWTKSSVYTMRKEFSKAEDVFKQRLNIIENTGNKAELASIYLNFAGFYIKD